MPAAGSIHWLPDSGPFAAIGLDTLVEGAKHGWLSVDGFAILDLCLTGLGGCQVVVTPHHLGPHSGILALDKDKLRSGAALMERLETYRGPAKMVSGQPHRAISWHIGKVSARTCVDRL
jgi:Icc protein